MKRFGDEVVGFSKLRATSRQGEVSHELYAKNLVHSQISHYRSDISWLRCVELLWLKLASS